MKRRRLFWLLGLGAASIAIWMAGVYIVEKLPARPVTRVFSSAGVKKVVVRASHIRTAKVSRGVANEIQISGVPTGDAQGYHSPDPFWRETPAKSWGLDFVARQYGSVLVISTQYEIEYIHHYYALEKLNIQLPQGVELVKEKRVLSGDGEPNLTKPT